jgi:hypothetical protein
VVHNFELCIAFFSYNVNCTAFFSYDVNYDVNCTAIFSSDDRLKISALCRICTHTIYRATKY